MWFQGEWLRKVAAADLDGLANFSDRIIRGGNCRAFAMGDSRLSVWNNPPTASLITVDYHPGGISMALITCDECGHQISDQAFQCPNCGSAALLLDKAKKFFFWSWKVAFYVLGSMALIGLVVSMLIRWMN